MDTTKHKVILALFLVTLSASSLTHADTVYLKNGGSVTGIVEKEDDASVEVNTGFGTATFKKSQVKSIERSDAEKLRKIKEGWEAKRAELQSKEKEFDEARDKRFKSAYENWMDEEKAKKLEEDGIAKQIDLARAPGGKGIMVEVLLNDSVKVNLLLDTGASIIALSRKAGEALGIELSDTKNDVLELTLADGKRTLAKAVILKSVKVQDVEVKNVMAAVMLDEVPTIGVTDGLLGMSFLGKFNLKTDLKNMKMTLEKIQ